MHRFAVVLLSIVCLLSILSRKEAQAHVPSSPCNSKWSGVCYRDLEDAVWKMRSTSLVHELLEYAYEDSSYVYCDLPTVPILPSTSWRTTYIWTGKNPANGPLFPTYGEALEWVIDRAAQPSLNAPTRIVSPDLVFRGEKTISGKVYRYFSHNYETVPLSSVNLTDTTPYNQCPSWTPGQADARIGSGGHYTYSLKDDAPSTVSPHIYYYVFGYCRVDGIFWSPQGFPLLRIYEVTGIPCNQGYNSTGGVCVGNLATQIEKLPSFVLEEATQPLIDRRIGK